MKYILYSNSFCLQRSFPVHPFIFESLIFLKKNSFDLITGQAHTKFKAKQFHFLRGRACVAPFMVNQQ